MSAGSGARAGRRRIHPTIGDDIGDRNANTGCEADREYPMAGTTTHSAPDRTGPAILGRVAGWVTDRVGRDFPSSGDGDCGFDDVALWGTRAMTMADSAGLDVGGLVDAPAARRRGTGSRSTNCGAVGGRGRWVRPIRRLG
jgi:hypothetical protein